MSLLQFSISSVTLSSGSLNLLICNLKLLNQVTSFSLLSIHFVTLFKIVFDPNTDLTAAQ